MNGEALSRWHGWGITVLRITVGVVFMAHGGQKLFVLGFDNVAAFMGKIGVPAPMLAAIVVTLVELLGGAALVVGAFTRWAAAPLAITMLVAIVTVHLKAGFFLPTGYEFALTLFSANVALLLLGSGEASVDGLRRSRRSSSARLGQVA
jgi:putative oxidoreductase